MTQIVEVIRLTALQFLIIGALCQTISIPTNPCPYVKGCTCPDDNTYRLECVNIGATDIPNIERNYPQISTLSIVNWDGRSRYLDLDLFSNMSLLRELRLTDGHIAKLHSNSTLNNLEHLDLSNNWLENFDEICSIVHYLPSLDKLILRNNYISATHPCAGDVHVTVLDLYRNRLRLINGTLSDQIEYLDLSSNALTSINNIPKMVNHLNISSNPLKVLIFPTLTKLKFLDLSRTSLIELPYLDAPLLTSAFINDTTLELADLNKWRTPNLKRMAFSPSYNLMGVVGSLPAPAKEFAVSNSRVTAFPISFFARTNMKVLNVSNNNFDCDPCVMYWAVNVRTLFKGQSSCQVPLKFRNCTVGVSKTQPSIATVKHGRTAFIACSTYGNPPPTVQWWKYRPDTYLGKYDPVTKIVNRDGINENVTARFSLVGNGYLRIENVVRSDVERYVCVAKNDHGTAWGIVELRLDYTDWYSLDLFESVFWGALAFCIVLCALSFLLNITWILTRKSILWWIQRAERLSRVRKMVEAMEKYRVRQMDSLHDKYARRIQLVRDNYHQQVEALRVSYSSQAERFRDYRAAQMESVTSHLENIRDNYQQQLNRVREYGSRRADQLWESYERQVNRMRTFSLQHRLKIMRQYKVKQRYLNKLLESFQDAHSPEALRKHEEEVRAALDLPEPEVPERHPLSRSSSFYSLPEYVLDDNGQLRPSPLVPNIRFPLDQVDYNFSVLQSPNLVQNATLGELENSEKTCIEQQ